MGDELRGLVVAVDVGSTSARAGVFDARGRRLARGRARLRGRTAAARSRGAQLGGDLARRLRGRRAARWPRQASPGARRRARLRRHLLARRCSTRAAARSRVSTTGRDEWNVVMWADHRAVAEAEEITATGHRASTIVGGTMSPEMELPKLLWLKRHLPQAWARYGLALDLTDFLTWRASGRIAVSACTVTCKWTYLNHEDAGLAGGSAAGDRPRRPAGAGAAARSGRWRSAAPRARSPRRRPPSSASREQCVVGVGLIDAHAGGLGLARRLRGVGARTRDWR